LPTERAAFRRSIAARRLRHPRLEAETKLKRLYDAIGNGAADLSDPMLKDRIAKLKTLRD
jgi:site-specific DNA recombinase